MCMIIRNGNQSCFSRTFKIMQPTKDSDTADRMEIVESMGGSFVLKNKDDSVVKRSKSIFVKKISSYWYQSTITFSISIELIKEEEKIVTQRRIRPAQTTGEIMTVCSAGQLQS